MQKPLLFKIFLFSYLISRATFQWATSQWYSETLYDTWKQSMQIDKVLYEEKTNEQELIIFENKTFGRVLALDGIIQITSADEYMYQEMLAHVPLLAHDNPQSVLIIGGGDGGILREVLRHKNLTRIVLVEIDSSVIELSQKLLPEISQNSFTNPRVEIIITDGAEYVKNTHEKFDVIICDSTDPEGPGAVLFSSDFYKNCKNILQKNGIFVNQNGVPFIQKDEIALTYTNRLPYFNETSFYLVALPTYIGGFMALGWATDCTEYQNLKLAQLEKRLQQVEGEMKYYTPQVHLASFALPVYIQKMIPNSTTDGNIKDY